MLKLHLSHRIRIARLLAAALVVAGLVEWNAASTNATANASAWNSVLHKAGAFFLQNTGEVDAAANLGLSLVFESYTDPSSPIGLEMQARGITYIDMYPWEQIVQTCGKTFGHCTISPVQEKHIVNAIRLHLARVQHDPLVAGFYILDDNPGHIMPTLNAITRLVHDANASSIFPRPTICALGITLDWRPSLDVPYKKSHSQFMGAIANYSPTTCDIPDVYAYGIGRANGIMIPENQTDWTASALIPYVTSTLQAHGWNPASGFISTPQTFHNTDLHDARPTSADIAAETAGFCSGGAISVVAFAWDDGGQAGRHDLFNTPAYRSGYQAGLAQCERLWHAVSRPSSPAAP
jgi:hypothetical protein